MCMLRRNSLKKRVEKLEEAAFVKVHGYSYSLYDYELVPVSKLVEEILNILRREVKRAYPSTKKYAVEKMSRK